MPRVPYLSRKLYNEVMMADDFTCVYCGLRTPEITIDHFIPRSRGGPESFDNLFACCIDCNNLKGDRPISEMGMQLLFGRFHHSRRPKRIAPPMPPEHSAEQIAALSIMQDNLGGYAFSANEICKAVHGHRGSVLAMIRTIRATPAQGDDADASE